MKHVKKIMALAVALVMCIAMAMPAMAASITIERDDTYDGNADAQNRTYIYYKIFDADYTSTDATEDTESPVSYSLAVDSEWASKLATINADTKAVTGYPTGQSFFDLALNADKTKYIVTAKDGYTSAQAQTAAKWLLDQARAEGSGITGTNLTYDEATYKWTSGEIDKGYYLVYSENSGANLILATTDISLNEKSTYPSVDKKQNDTAATDAYANDAVNVQVGDTIYYSLEVYVPADANKNIVLTDVMSLGLTPAEATSITAKADDPVSGAEPETYSTNLEKGSGDANWSASLSDHTYTITIKPTEATKGKYVQFLLSAVVNKTAITTADANNKNEVSLKYDNYSQTDFVEYDVYATGAVKFDGATGTVDPETNVLTAVSGKTLTFLSGAEFDLIDSDGTTVIPVLYDETNHYYYPKNGESGEAVKITSVDNATGVVIRGLDNQTYYLKEIKAPTGYNLMTELATLKVVQDTTGGTSLTITDATCIAKVENNQGSVLPSTGGIGTTIFYVVGSILLVGAAILLITKRRMKSE